MARTNSGRSVGEVQKILTIFALTLTSHLIVNVCESQCASLGGQTRTQNDLDGHHVQSESHNVDDMSDAGEQPDGHSGLYPSVEPQELPPPQNNLLLVTLLKQTCLLPEAQSFLVDQGLVSIMVTITFQAEMTCSLGNSEGKSEYPSETGKGTIRWLVASPSAGRWVVKCDGQGNYSISVQGESLLDTEITLYHIDPATGVSQLVQHNPTTGRQMRIIVDVVGEELMDSLFSISLVTSDGRSLLSDWLRHTGGPTDPQYAATLTWPAEPVYIVVLGKESNGEDFQRQSPYLLVPTLVDLRLLGDPSTSVMQSSVPLTIRFVVTNYGQSDTLLLTATVDNEIFEASVSPSMIVLGHGDRFTGSVTVVVEVDVASETGLLQVTVKSRKDPDVTQVVTRLLTVETVDDTAPSCHVIGITGNCTADLESLGPRSGCNGGQWTVHAAVSDDKSGLGVVSFDNVSFSDEYVIDPFVQTTNRVLVFYRTSCCKKSITLLTSDVAGNPSTCEFLRDEATVGFTTDNGLLGTVATRTVQPSTTTPPSPVELSSTTSSSVRSTSMSRSVAVSETPAAAVTVPGKTTVTSASELPALTSFSLSLTESSHLERLTREQGKETGEDNSNLKMAAVVLGSIGGLAGMSIVVLCTIYCLRVRRFRRGGNRGNDDGRRNAVRRNINRQPQSRFGASMGSCRSVL